MELRIKLNVSVQRYYGFLIKSLTQDIEACGQKVPNQLAGFRYKKPSGTKVHVGNLKENRYYKVSFINEGKQASVEYRFEPIDETHCILIYCTEKKLNWLEKHRIKRLIHQAEATL